MPGQFNGSEADMIDASFSRCPIKPKLLGPVGKPTCESPYEGVSHRKALAACSFHSSLPLSSKVA